MKLTDEEKKMLDGGVGQTISKMMELLVAIGEAFYAEKMAPVQSVHVTSVASTTLRQGGNKFIEEIASSQTGLRVLTTVNPSSIDYAHMDRMRIPRHLVLEQTDIDKNVRQIGAVPCYTCTPYLIGNLPRFGQHVAWGEAHAVILANSILGARTNPEGGPSAIASAVTGRTPLYGLHLEKNRKSDIVIRVESELNGVADFGVLGYWTGGLCQNKNPYFKGISPHAMFDEMKMLSAGFSCLTSQRLFHAEGLTPEFNAEYARPQKNSETAVFGKKEFESVWEHFNAVGDDLYWIALGCPHCSIAEIREIAGLLNGKSVSPNLELWICMSDSVKRLSDRSGYSEAIERAGARMITGTCPVLFPREILHKLGFKSVVTNSVHMAHYLGAVYGIPGRLGKLDQCLDASLRGKWK